MILIINNESQYIHTLEKYLSDKNIEYVELQHDQSLDDIDVTQIERVFISGGTGSPDGPLDLSLSHKVIDEFQVPILGICLGFEIIGVHFGATFSKLPEREVGLENIIITLPEDPIFKELPNKIQLMEKHQFCLSELSNDLITIATSEAIKIEAIRHVRRPIYGFQSHPETFDGDGPVIIDNFLALS